MIECDILIVGSGPAGASLAYNCVRNGLNTILLEKKKNIDMPVRCAESVPASIVRLFDFKIAGINSTIECTDTYIDESIDGCGIFEKAAETRTPGFILNRNVFLSDIVGRFEKSGGRYINCAKIEIIDGVNVLSDRTGTVSEVVLSTIKNLSENSFFKIRSRIVAGADGPASFIGKYIDSTNKNFITAFQENIKFYDQSGQSGNLFVPGNRNKIFFAPYLFGGYGWVFPKQDSLNAGIGVAPRKNSKNIKDIFKIFYKQLNNFIQTDGKVERKITGLIPVSGIVDRSSFRNFVLLGDAAGLCNPITGAGIFNAVYSAKLASEIVLKTIANNDFNVLKDLNRMYALEFGRSINHALSKRKYLQQNWDNTYQTSDNTHFSENGMCKLQFKDLICKNWIAFKEYWN